MQYTTEPLEDGAILVRLQSRGGGVSCRYHQAPSGPVAVLWVFGAGGGWGGPARGLYPRLAGRLVSHAIASLEVAYRRPGDLPACIADVELGVDWLQMEQHRPRVVLVGHSFGGAVVLSAAARHHNVFAVAALSPQSCGAHGISQLNGKPVLLIHGEDDEVLPDRCSRDLYRVAKEPRRLILYAGCRHGLDECQDELDRDLYEWLMGVSAG